MKKLFSVKKFPAANGSVGGNTHFLRFLPVQNVGASRCERRLCA